jgi:hypothetical protein
LNISRRKLKVLNGEKVDQVEYIGGTLPLLDRVSLNKMVKWGKMLKVSIIVLGLEYISRSKTATI